MHISLDKLKNSLIENRGLCLDPKIVALSRPKVIESIILII